MVKRIVNPEVPPRVEYGITDLGLSMQTMLEGMWKWGELDRSQKQ